MGCITIFHHHLGNTVCFFFQPPYFTNLRKLDAADIDELKAFGITILAKGQYHIPG